MKIVFLFLVFKVLKLDHYINKFSPNFLYFQSKNVIYINNFIKNNLPEIKISEKLFKSKLENCFRCIYF